MLAPLRHRRDKFSGVTFGVPFAGIRVNPAIRGFGIKIVKKSLHEPRVQQKSLDAMALPSPTRVSQLAVDVKILAANGDLRVAVCLRLRRREAETQCERQ